MITEYEADIARDRAKQKIIEAKDALREAFDALTTAGDWKDWKPEYKNTLLDSSVEVATMRIQLSKIENKI